jgi:serine/threonine-protein kinase HipA
MSQYLEVSLINKPLGVFAWDRDVMKGQFEFLPAYLSDNQEISPILYSKKILRNKLPIIHFKSLQDLPAFFTDCIPGKHSNRVLRYAIQNSGRTPESLSPLSVFSILGNRGIGALGFEPKGYPELDETKPVEIDKLVRDLRYLYQSGSKDLNEKKLRELLRCSLFTNSSEPEFFLAINDYNGEVLSGQGNIPKGFEAWKLKVDGVLTSSTYSIGQEYLYYKKAIECGIEMVQCRQLKESTHTHLLVRRIDRVSGERIHVLSYNALRDEPVDSYEAIFRCMRQLRINYPEIVQMYKRMIFNVIVGNTGENGLNIYFTCKNQNEWHLAPASGIYPTPWIKNHLLSICGKNNKIEADDLIKFGELQNIKKCVSIVEMIKNNCSYLH